MTAENRNVSPGDEASAVDLFEDVKSVYSQNADWYKYRRWALDPIAHVRFRAWRRGRRALNSIEDRHTRLIDAYTLIERTKRVTVCETHSKSNRRDTYDLFVPPSASQYVDQRLSEPGGPGDEGPGDDGDDNNSGTDCWYEYETYYKSVPNKNDGFLGTAYTTWDESPVNEFTSPNLDSHSILYSDEGTSRYERGGTGFNHAEMVYNERRFSSSNDPHLPDDAFDEGDQNPSMRDAERWVRNTLN